MTPFHPDILSLEPFVPHTLEYLVANHAFPEGSMPPAAYDRLCGQYAASGVAVERISYRSDGLSVTGLIAAPAGPAKGLVIYNRGGSGNYGMLTVHAAIRQFVPLVRAGYVVAGSNYRGNDGGEGQDEFGGRDVDDALALADIASRHPALPASAPRYLMGHSRGGMMSFLMMKRGYTPRAAIGIAPVCDVAEWNRPESRMREYVYKRYIPGFLADEAGALAARSVLNWPDAVRAPLLLLHGTNDDAVPHVQSQALALRLQDIGKPCELVLYEGGNHALTRHWDDVTGRTLSWLAHHS